MDNININEFTLEEQFEIAKAQANIKSLNKEELESLCFSLYLSLKSNQKMYNEILKNVLLNFNS